MLFNTKKEIGIVFPFLNCFLKPESFRYLQTETSYVCEEDNPQVAGSKNFCFDYHILKKGTIMR